MNAIQTWNKMLTAILLVLAAVLFLLFNHTGTNQNDPEVHFITDIPVSNMNAVAINHSSCSIGMILYPSGIELIDQSPENYSQQKLSALVYKICHLPAMRTLPPTSDQHETLASYGLDTPSVSISLIPVQGETRRLCLGTLHPMDGSCYVKMEDDDTIYLISPEDASMLFQTLPDLRILDLYPPLTSNQLAKLEKLQVTCEGRTWSIVRDTDDSGSLYQLSEPVQVPLDWQTAYTRIIEPFMKLVPDTFLSETAPPARYGLDDPPITLTAVIDGQEYVSRFSPGDNGRWYCSSSLSPRICSIPSDLVEFMSQDYIEFLSTSVYTRNLNDISSVTISAGGKSQTVELSGDGPGLEGRSGKKIYDSQMITDLYRQVTTIPAAGVLEQSDQISPDPCMVLIFRLHNGQTDILEFLPVSDRQCAVSLNGEIHFTTYTAVLSDIAAYFAHFTGEDISLTSPSAPAITLGGASGGYTSGRKEIIDLLRQRSRPYLFSNTLAPAIVGASLELFDMLEESTEGTKLIFRMRLNALGNNNSHLMKKTAY